MFRSRGIQLLKYLIEGLAVAIVAYLVTGGRRTRSLPWSEVAGVAAVSALTLALLDAVFALPRCTERFELEPCIVPNGTAVINPMGAIFLMKEGELRPFTSLENYKAWGSPEYQEMDDATIQQCTIGPPLERAPEPVDVPETDELTRRKAVDNSQFPELPKPPPE